MRTAVLGAAVLVALLALAIPAPARAAGATLALSPTQGPPATPVTASGQGFPPGASVDLVWHTMQGSRVGDSGFTEVGSTIATATADSQGSFTASFTVPYDLGGPAHKVEAVVGNASLATASFTLTRQAWIEPTEGPEGTPIEVRLVGGGWTQYDNNVGITYDNAFLGFACSFNSQGNISVWVQAVGGAGPHVVGVYPALYYGPSDGPTPWKHAALNPADLPTPYEPQLFTFTITSGGSGVSYLGGRDLHEVTTPDSLSIPLAPATPVADGTPRLSVGNGGKGVAGGDLPYALEGFPAGATVELRWSTTTAATKIGGTLGDKFLGWTFTAWNRTLARVTVSADGSASGTLRSPYDFGGVHTVYAVVGDQVLTSEDWMIVPRFTASMSADGTQVRLQGTGLGWEKYTSVWDVLYDGRLSGYVSAFTANGNVNVTIPAVGGPGLHTIDIHEGSNGWPYLNMHESPWPWEPVYRFAFTTGPLPSPPEATVPLWTAGSIVVLAVLVAFAVGLVRGRRTRKASAAATDRDG